MAKVAPPSDSPRNDDAPLLIAALEHARNRYDSRINWGLQVVNYYLIASAVLATAYVSAFNSKLYVVATVIGFSGILLTTVSFTVGYVQWRSAIADEGALAEVEDRIADRLGIEDFGMPKKRLPEQFSPTRGFLSITAFCLAALLNIGSIVYVIDR